MAPADTDLILRAQQGDFSAFEELVYRYDKQVLTLAARFVRSADDANDIYQEVFLRVYQGLRRFKLQSEFTTWLYRITTNVCLTHRSRRRKRSHESLDEEVGDTDGEAHGARNHASSEPLPDQKLIDQETEDEVRMALEHLSPQQRMVFTLKHYQGLKIREISEILECSEGTVKKHLFTATQRMRQLLAHLIEEGAKR